MLEIVDLTTKNGDFMLNSINLRVEKRNCHIIFGENGSGKTTLIESILGIKKIFSGKIFLDGRDITNTPTESRGITYVPQDLALFPNMTVKENIDFVRKINNKICLDEETTDELIGQFKLNHLLNTKVSSLSGGEKQKVAFLRAFISGRRVLLLDEPFSSLDITTKNNLYRLLKDCKIKLNLLVVLVTHDINEALLLGDSFSFISKGRLYEFNPNKLLFLRNSFANQRNLSSDFLNLFDILNIDPKLFQTIP